MKLITPFLIALVFAFSLTSIASAEVSAEKRVQQLQQEIERIEALCVPSKGKSRSEVEKKFGQGQPASNSKVTPKGGIPQDSRYRSYDFCPNGTLFICYDKEWKVLWAHFLDPFSTKGRFKPASSDERIKELEPRLEQMKQILKEYQRRFKQNNKRQNKALHPTAYSFGFPLVPRSEPSLPAAGELSRSAACAKCFLVPYSSSEKTKD